MAKIVVGVALRERLGDSCTRDLDEFVTRHSEAVRADAMQMCNARVDGLTSEILLVKTELKTELTAKIGDLKVEMVERLSDLRVELLRWSFVFWLGQVAALFAAMAMFAEWIRP